MTQNYRDAFLNTALSVGVFEKDERGRIILDPMFGGNAHLLQSAAFACRQAINKTSPLYEVDAFMSFEHSQYPLVTATAMQFLGGDAKKFFHYSNHRLTGCFLEGKKVILIGTIESETQIQGAVRYMKQWGATVIGVLILFSETATMQNPEIDVPIVRIFQDTEIEDALMAIA